MSDFFSPEEMREYNEIGLKGLAERSRHKNRFHIIQSACSISAVIISVIALIVSIIALVQA